MVTFCYHVYGCMHADNHIRIFTLFRASANVPMLYHYSGLYSPLPIRSHGGMQENGMLTIFYFLDIKKTKVDKSKT